MVTSYDVAIFGAISGSAIFIVPYLVKLTIVQMFLSLELLRQLDF